MNKALSYIFFFLLMATFPACHTSSNVTNNETKGNVKSKFSNEAFKHADALIRTANFDEINITTNMNGHSLSCKASMKIVCDSMIQISLQPMMGIEMARINLIPDKITLISKLNGKYFETDYNYITTQTGMKVTFFDLQAMLLNKIFIPNMGFLNTDGVLLQLTPTAYPDGGTVLKSSHAFNGYRPEFTIDNNMKLIYTIITTSNGMLKCAYDKFQQSETNTFPYRYKLSIVQGAGGNNINEAEITIGQVTFNQPIVVNPINISDYKKVKRIEDLIPKMGGNSSDFISE